MFQENRTNSFWTTRLSVGMAWTAGMWYLSKHFTYSANISLSIQKNEKNHKNSTPSKIKFHIMFIYIFVSLIDIKKNLTWKGFEGRCGRGGKYFFPKVTIYFINVIIQTLHIRSFILVYIDILHIINIFILQRVFPSSWKIAHWPIKMDLLPQFLTWWLKQTSFCRELDCLDRHNRSFCVFDHVPLKKHTLETLSKKILENVFQKLIIQKFKKMGMWRPAPSGCKWN